MPRYRSHENSRREVGTAPEPSPFGLHHVFKAAFQRQYRGDCFHQRKAIPFDSDSAHRMRGLRICVDEHHPIMFTTSLAPLGTKPETVLIASTPFEMRMAQVDKLAAKDSGLTTVCHGVNNPLAARKIWGKKNRFEWICRENNDAGHRLTGGSSAITPRFGAGSDATRTIWPGHGASPERFMHNKQR